ncbi:Pectin methylesterase [Anopheles sinensis]|uniref:Pectin methylesterase n=1 Tax=Anopheles sinensis TaxID=74873 RepID=A0A084VZL7_ANOSI|nr:Pectin methylesterase [Anopheles sinensis]
MPTRCNVARRTNTTKGQDEGEENTTVPCGDRTKAPRPFRRHAVRVSLKKCALTIACQCCCRVALVKSDSRAFGGNPSQPVCEFCFPILPDGFRDFKDQQGKGNHGCSVQCAVPVQF